MDFERMNRKELQALCKKRGIPANKTNLEMACLLAFALKVNENPNSVEEVGEKEDDDDAKIVKRVRFNPVKETKEYEPSNVKRRGRSRSGKESLVVLPDLTRKRGRGGGIKSTVAHVEDSSTVKEAEVGVSKRTLRSREVVIGGDGEGRIVDLVVSRRELVRGGSRKRRIGESSEGVLSSEGVCVENLSGKEDAEGEKVVVAPRRNTRKHKSAALLSEEFGQTKVVGRNTRSRANVVEGNSCSTMRKTIAVVHVGNELEQVVENEAEVVNKVVKDRNEEVGDSKIVGRVTRSRANATQSEPDQVVENEAEVVKEVVKDRNEVGDSKIVGRVTRSRANATQSESEQVAENKAEVEKKVVRDRSKVGDDKFGGRITRSRVNAMQNEPEQVVEGESKVVTEEFNEGPQGARRNVTRRKSVAPQQNKVETVREKVEKKTKRRLRNLNLEVVAEAETSVDSREEIKKSIVGNDTMETLGTIQGMVHLCEHISGNNGNANNEAVGVEAVKQGNKGGSKGVRRHVSRRGSVVPRKTMAESNREKMEKETKKQAHLEVTAEAETLVDSREENSKSTVAKDALGTLETIGRMECLGEHVSENGDASDEAMVNSRNADGVAKVGLIESSDKLVLEETSLAVSEPSAKPSETQLTENASSDDWVEEEPVFSESIAPVKETSFIEDAGLTMPEATGDSNPSCSTEILEDSKVMNKLESKSSRKTDFIGVSAGNSTMKGTIDLAMSWVENITVTPLNLIDYSTEKDVMKLEKEHSVIAKHADIELDDTEILVPDGTVDGRVDYQACQKKQKGEASKSKDIRYENHDFSDQVDKGFQVDGNVHPLSNNKTAPKWSTCLEVNYPNDTALSKEISIYEPAEGEQKHCIDQEAQDNDKELVSHTCGSAEEIYTNCENQYKVTDRRDPVAVSQSSPLKLRDKKEGNNAISEEANAKVLCSPDAGDCSTGQREGAEVNSESAKCKALSYEIFNLEVPFEKLHDIKETTAGAGKGCVYADTETVVPSSNSPAEAMDIVSNNDMTVDSNSEECVDVKVKVGSSNTCQEVVAEDDSSANFIFTQTSCEESEVSEMKVLEIKISDTATKETSNSKIVEPVECTPKVAFLDAIEFKEAHELNENADETLSEQKYQDRKFSEGRSVEWTVNTPKWEERINMLEENETVSEFSHSKLDIVTQGMNDHLVTGESAEIHDSNPSNHIGRNGEGSGVVEMKRFNKQHVQNASSSKPHSPCVSSAVSAFAVIGDKISEIGSSLIDGKREYGQVEVSNGENVKNSRISKCYEHTMLVKKKALSVENIDADVVMKQVTEAFSSPTDKTIHAGCEMSNGLESIPKSEQKFTECENDKDKMVDIEHSYSFMDEGQLLESSSGSKINNDLDSHLPVASIDQKDSANGSSQENNARCLQELDGAAFVSNVDTSALKDFSFEDIKNSPNMGTVGALSLHKLSVEVFSALQTKEAPSSEGVDLISSFYSEKAVGNSVVSVVSASHHNDEEQKVKELDAHSLQLDQVNKDLVEVQENASKQEEAQFTEDQHGDVMEEKVAQLNHICLTISNISSFDEVENSNMQDNGQVDIQASTGTSSHEDDSVKVDFYPFNLKQDEISSPANVREATMLMEDILKVDDFVVDHSVSFTRSTIAEGMGIELDNDQSQMKLTSPQTRGSAAKLEKCTNGEDSVKDCMVSKYQEPTISEEWNTPTMEKCDGDVAEKQTEKDLITVVDEPIQAVGEELDELDNISAVEQEFKEHENQEDKTVEIGHLFSLNEEGMLLEAPAGSGANDGLVPCRLVASEHQKDFTDVSTQEHNANDVQEVAKQQHHKHKDAVNRAVSEFEDFDLSTLFKSETFLDGFTDVSRQEHNANDVQEVAKQQHHKHKDAVNRAVSEFEDFDLSTLFKSETVLDGFTASVIDEKQQNLTNRNLAEEQEDGSIIKDAEAKPPEDQHGEVSELKYTQLAVSDQPNLEEIEDPSTEDNVPIHVDDIQGSTRAKIHEDEYEVECDPINLKQDDNFNLVDVSIARVLSEDVAEPSELIEDQSTSLTNSVNGEVVLTGTIAEDNNDQQSQIKSVSPKRSVSVPEQEESQSFYAEQLNASVLEEKNSRTESQCPEDQHGEIAELKCTDLAVSSETNSEEVEDSKVQDDVLVKVDDIQGSTDPESAEDETEVECDPINLKEDDHSSLVDATVSKVLPEDVPKLSEQIEDRSTSLTSSDAGEVVLTGTVAEVNNDHQSQMENKKVSVGEQEESQSSFTEQLNASVLKRKNSRTVLIHGTPRRVHDLNNMKENIPSSKMREAGSLTALGPFSKRRPLEDLRKN